MKQLSGEILKDFKLGFHSEKENVLNDIWALPPHERRYFLILLDQINYLLVGINPTPPNSVNISSFSRIVLEPKGYAAACLKVLIEKYLVPLCRETGKRIISAHIATGRSEKTFKKLKKNLPQGIEKITISPKSCNIVLKF